MIRKSLIVMLAALLVCTSAQASILVLDQQNVVPGAPPANSVASFFVGLDFAVAQTFTAGVGGVLAQIDLQLARYELVPLVLEIRGTTAGVPNSTILLTLNLDPNTIPTFDFSVPFHEYHAGYGRDPGSCRRYPGNCPFRPGGDFQ